jgi:AcrR family transcriptional regulator
MRSGAAASAAPADPPGGKARREPVSVSRPLSNKAGQQLGAKGQETRRRLLDAAEQILRECSPFALTPAAIAKAAGASAATFYVYFDDVRELLLSLSLECGAKVEELFPYEDMFMRPDRLEADASTFIAMLNLAWDRHAPVLLYRNLEADRGERCFDDARTAAAQPILQRLREALTARANGGAASEEDVHAEAVVLLAAVERIAATTHRAPENGPPPERLRAALVRLLVQTFLGERRSDMTAFGSSDRTSRTDL